MADPKNPARPDSSPLKVTTAGDWKPFTWQHEAGLTTNKGIQPVPKIEVQVEEEVINKNTKVKRTKVVDQDIANALKKDLKNRNIK